MPPSQSLSDLLPDLAEGKSMAVRAVWDEFFGKLCRVAHHRLAGKPTGGADGEDVAIAAFASVCRRLKRGDYPELNRRDDLWRLLVAVTQRKACNLLRYEWREKRGGGKLQGESVFRRFSSTKGRGLDAVAKAEPAPDFQVAIAEALRHLLAALDEPTRRIALLRMEGFSNQEIAAKVGRSLPTVERKLKLIRATWSASDA